MSVKEAPPPITFDPVRPQIHPRAHEIMALVGIEVPAGYEYGVMPRWKGIPLEGWQMLVQHYPNEYVELVGLCEGDFPTFCALLAKVVPKGGGGTSPFIFNNAQRFLWNRMQKRIAERKPLFFVILKARQLGITTFMSAWQYWQLWRQSHVQTLMLGHIDLLAQRITSIFRVFHDELPDVGDIKPRLRQDTKKKTARVPKGEIYLTERGDQPWNSWGITGSARNVDQRGFQGTHFSGSEAAFWPKLNDLKDALLPQLPPPSSPRYYDCSVIFESSPQGQNEFYDLWQLAKNPDSEWESVFLPWFIQDDEYSMFAPDNWRMTESDRAVQKSLTHERKKYDGKPVTREQMYYRYHTLLNKYDGSEEAFDAEYAADDVTCFQMSKEMLFQKDMKYLSSCVQQAEEEAPNLLEEQGFVPDKFANGYFEYEPLHSPFEATRYIKARKPKFMYSKRGNVWMWEPPRHGHTYIIGADGSGGGGDRDGACAEVICVTCGRQAAELWDDRLDPEAFTDEFYHLALMYNEALVNPEVNWMGTIVLKRLMTGWGYSNVAREEKWDEITLKRNKYGFMTTASNKSVLVAAGVSALKGRYLRISGRGLYSELSTFQFDGLSAYTGKEMYSAAYRAHDDRVIALCLAMYAVRQSPGLYSEMASHQHSIPSAVDLRLNRSPVQTEISRLPKSFTDELPPEIANIFEGGFDNQAMPWKPTRGYMGW